jgi:hypothetical protein
MYKQPVSQQYKATNQGNDHALQQSASRRVIGTEQQGQNMGHVPAPRDQIDNHKKNQNSLSIQK